MPDPKQYLNSEAQVTVWAKSEKTTLAAHRLQEDLDAAAELVSQMED